SQQGPSQRKLYNDLMTGYNPLERPVFNDSQSLTVYFGLSLMQIMDVDEKNQVLTTNIWLQLVKCRICSTELSYLNKSTSMLRPYRARHENEVPDTPRINSASSFQVADAG
ncbi:hypothetical protein ILYODFUR_029280, partial [Ilyodon furcidens]